MYDLCALRTTTINVNANARLYLVKALAAGRTGIEVKHPSQGGDSLDPKDVAVPTDEHVRGILSQSGTDSRLPSTGVTAYVNHPETNPLNFEPLVLRSPMANLPPVDVSINGTNWWTDGLDFVEHVLTADISGVEDHVTWAQGFVNLRVKPTVRIRDDAKEHAIVA